MSLPQKNTEEKTSVKKSKILPKKIFSGDLVFFVRDTAAYPAHNDTWKYSTNIQRIIGKEEPLIYEKCLKRKGKLYHHFKCLGMNYVYCGLFNAFKKQT